MKLQLDLETLEQMIGGDSPFHLEIREGIVQTFARRHLKALVNTEFLSTLRQEIREEIKSVKKILLDELLAELPVKKMGSGYYSTGWLLDTKHPAYQQLRNGLKDGAAAFGSETANEVMDRARKLLASDIERASRNLQANIKAEVTRQLDDAFEHRVRKEINKRWKTLMAAAQEGAGGGA